MSPDVDTFLARTRVAYGPDAGAKMRVRGAVIAATSASSVALATKVAAAKLGSTTKVVSTLLSILVGGAVSTAVLVGALSNSSPHPTQHVGTGAVERVAENAFQTRPALVVGHPDVSFVAPPRSESPVAESSEPIPENAKNPAEVSTHEAKSDELALELALIRRAAQALREGQAGDARTALSEHRRRFPHGKLSVERWGLDVLVQCSRGQTAAARKDAERFLSVAPSSPLASHVREDCLK